MRILITGKNGAGKTYLATELMKYLDAAHFNADEVRKMFNDWDFSEEGRLRQAKRMKSLAVFASEVKPYVLLDFICPTNQLRWSVNADFVIWMSDDGYNKYADTAKMWEDPDVYNLKLTKEYEAQDVVQQIKSYSTDAR